MTTRGLARAVALRRESAWAGAWRAALPLLFALAAWMLAGAEPTAAARRARPDTTGVARKIIVDDRGIQIIGSGKERVVGSVPEQVVGSVEENVVRSVKKKVVAGKDHGRIQVSVDPSSGDVDVDAGSAADEETDSLGFDRGAVSVGPHGMGVDAGEDAGMVRMFSDAEVHPGERVEGDVVAVCGDVLVEGQVTGNVVAVCGSVRLTPGARIDGDAVAVGGVLEQPPGAVVGGESVSLGFLPIRWGAPSLGMLLGVVLVGWLVSLFVGWILFLLFPSRMLRTAVTASRRTGGSLVLGLVSGPLLIIAMVLLLVTVIGIPVAFLLPLAFLTAVWAGQLALTYALGCRLLKRPLGEGSMMSPLVAGTLFVATFFVLGTVLGRPEGVLRTIALFFDLLGFLLIVALSVIGIGAFLLSRMGTRPREIEYPHRTDSLGGAAAGRMESPAATPTPPTAGTPPTAAPFTPPATPGP